MEEGNWRQRQKMVRHCHSSYTYIIMWVHEGGGRRENGKELGKEWERGRRRWRTEGTVE